MSSAQKNPPNASAEQALQKCRIARYDKFPDRLSRPMSRGQAATLRTLSVEAYQPKLFEENLTRDEADRRIEALRQEIALANSF
jgi:hypothetical protein